MGEELLGLIQVYLGHSCQEMDQFNIENVGPIRTKEANGTSASFEPQLHVG